MNTTEITLDIFRSIDYDSVSWDFIKEFHTLEEMMEYIKNR